MILYIFYDFEEFRKVRLSLRVMVWEPGAPEPRGQLPPLPFASGGSAGAAKCPFAV